MTTGSSTNGSWGWVAAYAEKNGLTYEPDADERWLRAFEPFTTLRTPLRYAHALHSTGASGSVSVARFFVGDDQGPESSAWIVLGQDVRLREGQAAAVSELRPTSPFAESSDLLAVPRRPTNDPAFDRLFATFAATDRDVDQALTPSLRRLVLSWRIPLHFEIRPGAFVLAPFTLPPDPSALAWLLGAVSFFGEKAAKRVK